MSDDVKTIDQMKAEDFQEIIDGDVNTIDEPKSDNQDDDKSDDDKSDDDKSDDKKSDDADDKKDDKKGGEDQDDDDDQDNDLDLEDPDAKKDDDSDDKSDDKTDDEPSGDDLTLTDYESIAKESGLNLELKSNTREGLIQAIKERDAKQSEKLRAEVIEDVKAMKGMSPETQYFLKRLNAGEKMEQIQNPAQGFDNFLALSPEERAKKNLMLTDKISEEEADLKMDELRDKGELTAYINAVTEGVRKLREEHIQKENEKMSAFVEQKQMEAIEADNKFMNDAEAELRKYTTFDNLSVPDKTINELVRRLKDPDQYRKRLENDPKFLAQLIIRNELHEISLKKNVDKALREGKRDEKSSQQRKRYNTTDLQKGDKKQQSDTTQSEGWEKLKDILDSGEEIRRAD